MEINPYQPPSPLPTQKLATASQPVLATTIGFLPTTKKSAVVVNSAGVHLYHLRPYSKTTSNALAIVGAIITYLVTKAVLGFWLLLFFFPIDASPAVKTLIEITAVLLVITLPFFLSFLAYRTILPSFCVGLFKPDALDSPLLVVRLSRLLGRSRTLYVIDTTGEKTEELQALPSSYHLQQFNSVRLASFRLTSHKEQGFTLTADPPTPTIPADLGYARFDNGNLIFHSKLPLDMLEYYKVRIITLLAVACMKPVKQN